MKCRKTIDVNTLREHVNAFLAAEHTTPEGRLAVASLLETVLSETGNYEGFNYLYWMKQGADEWREAKLFGGDDLSTYDFLGDQTRRMYF